MINYYQELNIDSNLKSEQLSEALKNAQRKWIGRTNAPDLNRRQEAERKVSIIEDAQKVLLDEKKREEYDSQLKNSVPSKNEAPNLNVNQNSTSSDSLIQQAWDLINLGRYADAIMVARRATEVDGSNSNAWAVLGYADYSWNNVQDAVCEYKKAISLRPNSDTYYCDLGNIYLDHNMIAEAEECANKAMHLASSKSYNRLLIGNIAVAKNEYDKAIAIFKELINEEPSNDSYKQIIANSYYSKGINYCYHHNDGYIYCIDEQNTNNMIACMNEAKKFASNAEYNEKITWGEKALTKKFDKSKWTLFIIPVLMLFSGEGLVIIAAIAIIAGLGYLSMRPQWRLTRNSLLGEKTAYDKGAWIFTATVGVFFAMILGFIEGLAESNKRS